MPKDRTRRSGHAQSVRVNKRSFAEQSGAVEHVEVGSEALSSATEILESITASAERPQLSKKEKQKLKQETFLQRLEAGYSPYSKSHERRLKKKAKEQIGTGMSDVSQALKLLDSTAADESKNADDTESKPKRNLGPGMIGQGKGATLSKKQRKRALQTEKFRQPKILATPEFASNPFQTIRTHVQNVLLKHDEVSS